MWRKHQVRGNWARQFHFTIIINFRIDVNTLLGGPKLGEIRADRHSLEPQKNAHPPPSVSPSRTDSSRGEDGLRRRERSTSPGGKIGVWAWSLEELAVSKGRP